MEVTGARLISPYYPLLIPLLLVGAGQAEMVRRRWWRLLAGGVLLLAVPVIILTPGRPLWPARTVLSWAQQRQIAPALVARALRVYIVYAGRSDPLANVRGLLPPKLKVVGFLADADDIDISLWRPFGERRVEHILLADSGEQIRQRQVEYIVIGGGYLAANGINLADWLGQKGGHLVANTTATMKVSEGPQPWYVVKL